MDIEELRKKAKEGDIASMKELAQAYLEGNGVPKNRAHYIKWLTIAAERGDVDAQMELIKFYSDKRSKYSNPEKALFWMRKAQEQGAEFSNDELAEAGDSSACCKKIEQYLFGGGKEHSFKKAIALLLKANLPKSTLVDFANRYLEQYCENPKEISNICYLIKKAYGGNGEELNDYAVELTKLKFKNNMKIAVSLFAEAYSLGSTQAAASYMYCLITGKGIRKNIKAAAKVYFDYKDKGIELNSAFASRTQKGKTIRIPKSTIWKRELTVLKFGKMSKSISDKLFVPMNPIFALPNEYWDFKKAESVRNEDAAIAAEVAKGNYGAADGCKDGGCTESLMAGQRVLFGYLGVFSLLLAMVIAFCTGHIPNWLVYTICILLFFPSVFGIEGKITGIFTLIPPLALVGYGLYNIWGNWSNIISNLTFWDVISVVFVIVVVGMLAIYMWMFSNYLMGFWFHYLVAIEWKYGSFKAFCFALITLGITLCGGYLLYQNGIIF